LPPTSKYAAKWKQGIDFSGDSAMSVHRLRQAAAMVSVALLAAFASAAQAQTDFSGFWEIRDELPRPAPASITPEATVHTERLQAQRAAETGVISPDGRWCRRLGVPFIMGSSPPLSFVQNPHILAIMAEQTSSARHIYLDGRNYPDPDIHDATSNGFSIGRFQGEDLIVETRYFAPDKGAPFIPGGGYKTEETHLVERMRLLDGGERMSIQFTWVDPKVFVEPHRYEVIYYRSPSDTYAMETWCDASDPEWAGLVAAPEQLE